MSDLNMFNSLYINIIKFCINLSKELVKQPNFPHCMCTSKFLPSQSYRLGRCIHTVYTGN